MLKVWGGRRDFLYFQNKKQGGVDLSCILQGFLTFSSKYPVFSLRFVEYFFIITGLLHGLGLLPCTYATGYGKIYHILKTVLI